MKFKTRKMTQRKVNKVFRDLNNCIQKDDMWKGRFAANQLYTTWYSFEDKSGGILYVHYELVDKKTGKKEIHFENALCSNTRFFASRLFWSMNNFIVELCKNGS